MAIFIISNNLYLRDGIILAGKDNGLDIHSCQFGESCLDHLNYKDTVILHLNLENKSSAKKLTMLNHRCKLLLVLSSSQKSLVCDADIVINAKVSCEVLIKSLIRLNRRRKYKPTKNRPLNKIEKIIINKSLEGKDVHLIAKSLSMTSKIVSNHRYLACRKIGAGRLTDLLVIKEHLIEDYVI